MNITKRNWNAGKLSPLMSYRQDLAKYQDGSRQLINYDILIEGGIQRRGGTRYCSSAVFDGRQSRLIPFQIDSDTYNIIEFYHLGIRFHKPQTIGGVEYDALPFFNITSVYTEDEIFDISYVQINDVIYLAHPNHPIQELKRVTSDVWTIAELDLKFAPMNDKNSDITHTLAYNSTTEILTSSDELFEEAKIGEYFQATYRQDGDTILQNITGNNVSTELVTHATNWGFETSGTWTATITIQYSDDDGATWNNLNQFSSSKNKNWQTDGEWTEEDIKSAPAGFIKMRLIVSNWVEQSNASVAQLYTETSKYDVTYRTKEYIDANNVKVDVIYGLPEDDKEVIEWKQGAFNDVDGYGKTVAFFEARLIIGGSPKFPQTLWMSQTDDLNNFLLGSADSDGVQLTMATGNRNTIQWIAAGSILAVGTTGTEHTISGGTTGITPTNIEVKTQSTYGGRNIQPVIINSKIMYVQLTGRKLREFRFEFSLDQWLSQDLTIFSEDITKSGIKQMDLQRQKNSRLWCVLKNGKVAYMTYDYLQKVYAWGEMDTDGLVESIAIVSTPNDYDKVYLTVKRIIDGQEKRYIEVIRHNPDDETVEDMYYVDSGLQFNPATSGTVNLSHLEGKEVAIVADGAIMNRQTVSNGSIDFDYSTYTTVSIGLPYTSKCETIVIDAAWAGDDTRRNKFDRILETTYCFLQSLGLKYGNDESKTYEIKFRNHNTPLSTPTPLFTGQKLVSVNSKFEKEPTVYFETDYPAPCTLLAIMMEFGGGSNL